MSVLYRTYHKRTKSHALQLQYVRWRMTHALGVPHKQHSNTPSNTEKYAGSSAKTPPPVVAAQHKQLRQLLLLLPHKTSTQ